MLTLLLGAFSVALLRLTCFVMKRRRINLVWELELYLGDRGHRKLIKPVRAVNRAFTSRENMEREFKFIRDWKRKQKEIEAVLRREIYLLEEKDALDAAKRDGLSPDEKTALLSKIEGDLGQIKPQLWKKAQDMVEINSRPENGSWILGFLSSDNEEWERKKFYCASGLGCCARGCGCCKEGRRRHAGQSVRYDAATYCTIECGCCIRWRGFRHLDDCKSSLRSALLALVIMTCLLLPILLP